MKSKEDASGTLSIRLDSGVIGILSDLKSKTGIPIVRFIEEAIVEKLNRLPKETLVKIGVKEIKEVHLRD